MSAKRIYLVNDDPTQLHLSGFILERAGYEVRTFESATAMLATVDEAPIDLFVVDLHMPGIDGWKLCRLLRSPDFEQLNDVPILVMSATFTGADVEAITSDLGANGFLTVPHTREELLHFVSELLNGAHPRRRSKALIVDDDPDVARTAQRVFARHGYEVTTAGTVAEALDLSRRTNFDVVVLDYHLPDGPCEELLDRFGAPADATVTLVITGDDDPSLPVRLLDRGADGYVRKPFDADFLVELARKSQRERSLLRVESVLEKRTRELKASERRYRSLYEAIPDLVFVVSHGGDVIEINGQVASLVDGGGGSLLGRPLQDVLGAGDEQPLSAHLSRISALGESTFEARLQGASGRDVDIEVTAVETEHRGRPAYLLVGRDLTVRKQLEEERRKLEDQLNHNQRLESLGVLAGGIAHDFNNLLVGMLGNATLALMDIPEGGPVYESVRQIEVAARRAAELTQQILTFSGKRNLDEGRIELSSLVSEMGQLMEPAVSRRANLRYQLAQSLPVTRGDGSQLRQVVMNLIMNASDALQGGQGVISIQTGLTQVTDADRSGYYLGDQADPGPYVFVEVRDNGAGMSEETRSRMFEPFFTTRFAGRGLGLAATLGIVRAHRGMVDVASTLGEGTRIRILLPAAEVERTGTSPGEDAPRARVGTSWTRGGRVLVADDEAPVRDLARAALARGGFVTTEVHNGASVLSHLDSGTAIDAILLDITMPGMDGLEVLQRLRVDHPELPVLLSSGYAVDLVPPEMLADPATDFLPKPYAAPTLLDGIGRLMARRRGSRIVGA
ncbi:MAG: response regulator [Longimicrobiales bacterium]